MEDEAVIRMNLVQVAEDCGYNVSEAANAREAIAVLERRNDIRIVLTDVRMPGHLDGLWLARAVRHHWPAIQLVLMSGPGILDDSDLDFQRHFVRKPYGNGQITAALRDACIGHY